MKIAVDSNVFTTQKYGGVSRYLVRLAEEFNHAGNDVKIFGWLHTNRHLLQARGDLTQMHYIDNFPRYTRRIAHHVGDLMAGEQISRWAPDIIHESFCHNRAVGPKSLPRVCTVHDMIHELFPEFWGRQDRTPEYRKATIERCNAVICVSESTRNDLLGMIDVDPEKVHVIHHGFEHMGGRQDIDPVEQRKLDSVSEFPYLLYVGARHGYKNFCRFLQGVALSGLHYQMQVVAFGGGALTSAESVLIADLGIAPSRVVQLSGSDALLEHLYCNATAFVYPSLYEGFGFPPLEAMAQECPVIASKTSSIPEVIGDAAEYFDPVDVSSIAAALCLVVANVQRRIQLVKLGRERLKVFSWSKCAKQTLDIYKSIMHKE